LLRLVQAIRASKGDDRDTEKADRTTDLHGTHGRGEEKKAGREDAVLILPRPRVGRGTDRLRDFRTPNFSVCSVCSVVNFRIALVTEAFRGRPPNCPSPVAPICGRLRFALFRQHQRRKGDDGDTVLRLRSGTVRRIEPRMLRLDFGSAQSGGSAQIFTDRTFVGSNTSRVSATILREFALHSALSVCRR